jgi:hypothetical protein
MKEAADFLTNKNGLTTIARSPLPGSVVFSWRAMIQAVFER